jgi:UDP-GlcNAc:undecaprenyl-phosphate GlcNAc-1-phosphate transferase
VGELSVFVVHPVVLDAAAVVFAVAVTLVICLKASLFGKVLSVMSIPDRRKQHRRETPQVGGIAILCGLICWISLELLRGQTTDLAFLSAVGLTATGIGLVGFSDDQSELSPVARVLLLAVFSLLALVVDHGFLASSLNWISFAPTAIPSWAYVVLLALAMIGAVNAINLADGQDGIVGSMFVIWGGCLYLSANGTCAAMGGVLVLLSLTFLAFNLRGKLFLGDCGSYGIGFAFGLLFAIAHAHSMVPLETIIVWLFIPVADCIRLLVSRPLRGVSPFAGDRDHFHHRLEDKMGKQKGYVCYISAVAITSLVSTLAPRFSLVCLCMLSAFYFSFAWLTGTEPARVSKPTQMSPRADNVVSMPVEKKDKGRQGAA